MALIEPRKAQYMNVSYAAVLFFTQLLTSFWFKETAINTLFWLLFAPDVLKYDWNDIEQSGEPLNIS